jgi:ATP-dependent exoDNAse (exonuclease V) beta subunit/pimeloyl-ACP methyl ester carboxylesterase
VRLAWTSALKQLPLDELRRIVPFPPPAQASQQWLELGKTLAHLHRELAADCMDFAKVAAALGRNHPEAVRWQALSRIQRLYLDQLHQLQLWDIQTARLRAIQDGEISTQLQIVVIGCIDLNRTQRSFLEAVGGRAQVWVAAPQERSDYFDALGCLHSEAWPSYTLDIPSDRLLVGVSPADQADLVATSLQDLLGQFNLRQVTLGVPDIQILPELETHLDRCGLPTRFGPGQALSQSPPAVLLKLIGDFLESHSFAALAALVRHPAVEWLVSQSQPELAGDWLMRLDEYYQEALPRTVDSFICHEVQAAPVYQAVVQRVVDWLQPLQSDPLPLNQWTERMQSVLTAAYPFINEVAGGPGDLQTVAAMDQINLAVSALTQIPQELEPVLSIDEFIEWLMRDLVGQLMPEPDDKTAVEMLGWLELPWDDTPALIVVGMHDGVTPESTGSDEFLPNQLRHQLGMLDNARRYARDLYYLQLLLATRKYLRIIVGKATATGDPLVPSRLLLACDLSLLPARVLHLVQEDSADILPAVKSRWQPLESNSRLTIPRPPARCDIKKMTVTSFRDYITCPYRFYLKHVLRLRGADDADQELDAAMFGNLVHDTLDLFGKSPVASSQDPEEISTFLIDQLQQLAQRQYGDRSTVAVEIQVQQAQARLQAFAIKQAQRTAQGWEIRFTEQGVGLEDQVKLGLHAEMNLIGRIDRIDYHRQSDQWAIWDYKTSEKAKQPLSVHWHKEHGWQDLQLPLYVPIARKLGVTGMPSLGYIVLPKQVQDVDFCVAEFTPEMIDSALQTADQIATQVAGGQFWPERLEAVDYDDFPRICQVHVQHVQAVQPERRLRRYQGYVTRQVDASVVHQARQRLDNPLVRTNIQLPPLLIRASAGTGKTYQLSNRLLQIVLSGQEVDGILATTFTRKAAGEIMHRMLQRLALACIDPKKQLELASGLPDVDASPDACLVALRRVASSIHRLQIGTLDSFFAQLARTSSLDMGLPASWESIDPAEEPRVQSQAITEMLELHDRNTLLSIMYMLTKGESSRRISDDVRAAVGSGYALFRETKEVDWRQLAVPNAPDLKEIQEALETIAGCRFNDRQIDPQMDKLCQWAVQSDWEQVIQHGVMTAVRKDPPTYYRKKLEAKLVAAIECLADAAKTSLLASCRGQTEATFQTLEAYDRAYNKLVRRQRRLAFADVTHLLAQWTSRTGSNQSSSTTDRTGIAQMEYRLDSKIQHLLLDEFQDTSPAQWQILQPLAASLGGAPRSEQSFFCVGDTKQAIYGWRGGVAQIFEAVKQSVSGLQETKLFESRRNSLPVTQAVNQVFQNLAMHGNFAGCESTAQRWSVEFPEHTTVHTDTLGYVQLQNLPEIEDNDLSSQEKRLELLEFAADQIAQLTSISTASVGVLFRTNDDVARMMALLRNRNVSASQDGGNPLNDSAAVELILSLVHLADHPGDKICEFHVRSSPLQQILPAEVQGNSVELSRWFRRRVSQDGLGRTIQWVSSQLASHLSWWDQQRLVQLVRSAQAFSDRGRRLREFESLVEQTRIALPTEAQVKVMTIHRSKGLEFDAVFLPALDQSLSKRAPYLIARQPDPCLPPDGVLRYMNSSVQAILPDSWQQAFAMDKASGITEALCLLYVAMTRARQALYMFTIASGKNARQDFSSLLHSTLASGNPSVDQPSAMLYQIGQVNWYLPR